ncbi:MAG: hypothetical protein JST93_34115 [Acidobacteria bacterium]|nr:hypothetical protein [Acidobacteriota bacterium]
MSLRIWAVLLISAQLGAAGVVNAVYYFNRPVDGQNQNIAGADITAFSLTMSVVGSSYGMNAAPLTPSVSAMRSPSTTRCFSKTFSTKDAHWTANGQSYAAKGMNTVSMGKRNSYGFNYTNDLSTLPSTECLFRSPPVTHSPPGRTSTSISQAITKGSPAMSPCRDK